MTIKTHSIFTRNAQEIVEQILLVCVGLYPDETEKKVWKMIVVENRSYVTKRFDDKDKEIPVTAAKLRIERVPQGFLDKVLRFFFGPFGVVINIPPVNSYVKIHAAEVNLMFGDRRVSQKRDPAVRILYQKDVDKILSTLKERVPELNTLLLE